MCTGASSVTGTVIIHKVTPHRSSLEDVRGPNSATLHPTEQSLEVDSEDHLRQCHLGSLIQVQIPRLLLRPGESDSLD